MRRNAYQLAVRMRAASARTNCDERRRIMADTQLALRRARSYRRRRLRRARTRRLHCRRSRSSSPTIQSLIFKAIKVTTTSLRRCQTTTTTSTTTTMMMMTTKTSTCRRYRQACQRQAIKKSPFSFFKKKRQNLTKTQKMLIFCVFLLVADCFQVNVSIDTSQLDSFNRGFLGAVGSCHAITSLRADWRQQLAATVSDIGVKRVRFHGLLDDEMSTVLPDGTYRCVRL